MKLSRLFLVVFLTLCAAFPALAEDKAAVTKDALLEVQPYDIMLGKPDAPVTIVEYASLSCTHCADFHNNVFPAIKEKYIDTGKVRFLLRDFPLNASALYGALVTRCAEQKHYYNFVKVLFKTQDNWAFKQNYQEVLGNIAKLGGLSAQQFDACMKNEKLQQEIVERRKIATDVLKIEGTPTFFINGEKNPMMSPEKFTALIDKLLAGAK